MSDTDVAVVTVAEEEQPNVSRYEGQIVTDEAEVARIVAYLEAQYDDEMGKRQKLIPRLEKWRRQLDADPDDKPPATKLENPSRIRPPLAQIGGQTMFAKLDSHFGIRRPFWTVKAIQEDPSSLEDAALMTEYLDVLAKSPTDLDLENVKSEVHLDAAVMPVAFAKVGWSTQRYHYKILSQDGGGERDVTSTVHDGPEISMWPIEQVVWPSGWSKIVDMPWIAFDYELPPHEVRARGARGEWILTAEVTAAADPTKPEPLKFREYHFFWDVDGNNIPEDMIWTVHPETKTVVQQMHNELGARGVEPFRYIRKTKSITGRGTGQLAESAQDEVEGIHNVRNDNMKIANMRMFVLKRAVLMNNRDSIFAGKMWIADNPREDMLPLQLGEVYPSSEVAEQRSWQMSARAMALDETTQGLANSTLGSRDTFKGASLRLQTQGGIFGSVAKGIQGSWSRVGMMVVLLLIRNKDVVIQNEQRLQRWAPDKIARLEKVLSIEAEEAPRRFRFEVQTTELDMTYEAKREATLALTQIYTTFAQQTIPLALQLFGPQGQQFRQAAPQAWEYMLQILVGSKNLMETTAKLMEFRETSRYIPDLSDWELMLETLRQVRQQQVAQMGGLKGESKDGNIADAGVNPAAPVGGGAGGELALPGTDAGAGFNGAGPAVPAGAGPVGG